MGGLGGASVITRVPLNVEEEAKEVRTVQREDLP